MATTVGSYLLHRLVDPGLGAGVGQRRGWYRGGHGRCNGLGYRGARRNNGRKAGVVYHPLRRLLVGTNTYDGLVDRRSGLAGHDGLLWDERIKRQQQREQHSADKQEITRYGHLVSLPPREQCAA